MNWLDIVLLVVIALSIAASFRKGFSREIISLSASVVALLCGVYFYGTAGAYLLPWMSSPAVANFVGFLLVFIGVLIAGSIVSVIVGRLVRTVGLSWFDRILGGAFGLVRGLLVSVALVTAAVAFAPAVKGDGAPEAVLHSRVAPYVVDVANVLVSVAPRELKDGFRRHYDRAKDVWDRTLANKKTSRVSESSNEK